jgi:hypothetical protein
MHQPRAGQPNTGMHLRARALVDRVYVFAFTVHAMLQANHHPDHSHHPAQPNVHHKPQQRQIARNTQRAHAKLRVPAVHTTWEIWRPDSPIGSAT